MNKRREKRRQPSGGMPPAVGSEWRATLDGLRDPVCLVDPAGIVRRCNRAFSRLAGLPFRTLIGRNCWQAIYNRRTPPPGCDPGKPGRRHPPVVLVRGRWYELSTRPVREGTRHPTGAVHVMKDVTDLHTVGTRLAAALKRNSNLLREVTRQRRQAHAYARRLDRAEEGERQRLARELHDHAGQLLTALGINLNVVRRHLPSATLTRAGARLDEAIAQVDELSSWMRARMTELRPDVLDDYGLTAALRWYAQRFSERRELPVHVQVARPWPAFPPDTETAVFRIVQEALTNVAKHARATAVQIRLDVSARAARLVIADDGVGFDPHATAPRGRTGWGLMTMRERAEGAGGSWTLDTRTGHGTRITVILPTARHPSRRRSPEVPSGA